jgi:hypothetical protein
MMEKINLFSLEKHAGPYETWPQSSRLFVNGQDTHQKVPGYQVEGQYTCDHGYILITNYDCPYEETDEFLLLNDRFEVIAKAGHGFYSPLINRHWPISESAIRIHYYDDTVDTLTIETKPPHNRPNLALTPLENIALDPKAIVSRDELRKRMDDLNAYMAAKTSARE